MDDKKKKFVVPEVEVINFENDDIITLSNGTDGDWWLSDSDGENW